MEDNKLKKINIPAADLPEVPRTVDGKIDLEAITIEIDEKNNKIIPDDIFDSYYRELPDKVINQSKTWRTANSGKIKILNSEDAKIQRAGGIASQATQQQRRTFKETIDYMLRQKAKKSVIEDLELTEDATNLDMIIASALRQASRGNTKAYEFLRDTAGEKPSENINANVNQVTPEQLELLEEFKKHNI